MILRGIQIVVFKNEDPLGKAILALDPMNGCDNQELDQHAIINRMRGEERGYKISPTELTFLSKFNKKYYSNYSNGTFIIKNFTQGEMKISRIMKGKIDLHSNFIGVPSDIFEEMKSKFTLNEKANQFLSKSIYPSQIKAKRTGKKLSIRFLHGKEMHLPIGEFFFRMRIFSKGINQHYLKTVFVSSHNSH